MELPQITGTEKQVAWANDIRRQHIDVSAEDDAKAHHIYGSEYPEYAVGMAEALVFTLTATPAVWWIERRGFVGMDMLHEAERELTASRKNERVPNLNRIFRSPRMTKI